MTPQKFLTLMDECEAMLKCMNIKERSQFIKTLAEHYKDHPERYTPAMEIKHNTRKMRLSFRLEGDILRYRTIVALNNLMSYPTVDASRYHYAAKWRELCTKAIEAGQGVKP